MKSLLIAAVVLATTTQSVLSLRKTQQVQPLDTVFDPSQMSDTQMVSFVDSVANRMWTSFIRGFYSKSNSSMTVDEQCFGPWIVEDMLQLDESLTQLLEIQGASIQDFVQIAEAAYRLAFKNVDYCRFEMFFLDISKFILKNYPTPDQIFENVQKHAIENMSRFTPIFGLINSRSEIKTYKQIYAATDLIGLNLGLILSSFLEFKRV